MPAQLPVLGGHLTFRVYDEDTVSDELVGSFTIEATDIINNPDGQHFWKNIYGSPLGHSGKCTDRMNHDPALGSLWKGRILMQCIAEKTDKPLLQVRDIDPEEVEKAEPCLEARQFDLRCAVVAAISLPEPTLYSIEVRVGERSWVTKEEAYCIDGASYNRWNEVISKDDSEYRAPYIDIYDIGSVFIYLVQKMRIGGPKRVCYYRGDIEEFLDPNPDLKWLQFSPDLSVGEVKEHYRAGIIGIKLSLWDVTANGPVNWLNYASWAQKMRKRSNIVKVRAYCFQARDLPAADEGGSSDPFLRITDCARHHDTRTIFDNVNPIWYETMDLGYEANSIHDLPPIIIDLYDMDVNTITKNSIDFLSRAVLHPSDIEPYSEGNGVPTPKWYPLHYKRGGPTAGEVLMSFAIVEDDFKFNTPSHLVNLPIEAGIVMREYNVMMNILGLRSLQSAGILPVKKAFINFNLKSMVSPEQGEAIENIKTEPGAPGPDPTLNTLIEFDIRLPTDELYCPRMACSVYDSIMGGFS